MSISYVVKRGDTLTSIAKAHGISSAKELYKHPDNTSFRAKRPNPDLIYPGDVVKIPELASVPEGTQLNVDLVKQKHDHDCWHAIAQMMFAYKTGVSVDPLSHLYQQDFGLSPKKIPDFLKETGMVSIPAQTYTAPGLEALLRRYGPLLMPIRDPSGTQGPHMMVITGVARGTLYLNDPGGGRKAPNLPDEYFKERDMYWFNYYLDPDVGLLYVP